MDVRIKNCNNIDSGEFEIIERKFNVKFGANGIGKSTLSKAIDYGVNNPVDLVKLKQFKAVGKDDPGLNPHIDGISSLRNGKVFVFNQEYIDSVLFKERELVENSYDIFIKTDKYKKTEEQINQSFDNLTKSIRGNEIIPSLINYLEEFSTFFEQLGSGKGFKSTPKYKSIKEGNKLSNRPDELSMFSPFFNLKNLTEWFKWHDEGKEYNAGACCPYCAQNIGDVKKKIEVLHTYLNSSIVKNTRYILESKRKLDPYFSAKIQSDLLVILDKPSPITDTDCEIIISVIKDLKNLQQKLVTLKDLSVEELRGVGDEIGIFLDNLKIQVDEDNSFNSENIKNLALGINQEIDQVISKIVKLEREIKKNKDEVNLIIKENEGGINSFLKNAGYKYSVKLIDTKDEIVLRLKHHDLVDLITGGKQHLSFGERNAFALALFVYSLVSKESDLIIVDDPVSSFDKHKKYAILELLLRDKNGLRGKTVLMLTHDIEPIIDTLKNNPGLFKEHVEASYLTMKDSKLIETKINTRDILSVAGVCRDIIEGDKDDLIKLVYLRRYLEIIGEEDGYQVLSNLFAKRKDTQLIDNRKPKVDEVGAPLEINDFNNGLSQIKKSIGPNTEFNYNNYLDKINDKNYLISLYEKEKNSGNSYSRVILYRMIDKEIDKEKEGAFQKFVKETYHIENDLLFQLSPDKFDLVPDYIIDMCDDRINRIKSESGII